MRICFLTYNLNVKNGGGRFSYEFIERLRNTRKNIEIKVLTTDGVGYDLEETIIPKKKINIFLSLWKFRKILKNYDIIHAFDGMPYGIIAVLSCIGLRKKIIITPVGSGSIRPLYNYWRSHILKWAFRKADRVISISYYTTKEIQKRVKDIKIETIPLATNFDSFIDKANSFNNQEKISEIIKLKPYILSVGGVKPRKGYKDSVMVFNKVSKLIPDLKYVIIGIERGSYYKELVELIDNLGLKDKIIFKKDLSDEELSFHYREAEIFMLLSQNVEFDVEGFGLVFLEAAIFGLPVVGTLDSGAQDAVLDKKNGYLVNPKDKDKISELIIKIIKDPELKENLGRNSMELARKRNWDDFTNKYLEVYELLFSKSI